MDRNIFRYNDGEQDRYGDPLALESNLIEALGDLTLLLQKINAMRAAQADPLALIEGVQARRVLIGGVRAAFGLKPFDPATGRGATDDLALGTYLAWVNWTQKKSGNGPDTPSTSPSTDSTPPTPTPPVTTTTAASS